MNENWTLRRLMFNDSALGDAKGDLVTERLQLVEYLVLKTRARVAHLDMEGANQVVYSLGDARSHSHSEIL